jgi:hypothetical protein
MVHRHGEVFLQVYLHHVSSAVVHGLAMIGQPVPREEHRLANESGGGHVKEGHR